MPDVNPDAHVACHDCDLLQAKPHLVAGETARCRRCGSLISENRGDIVEPTLALSIAAIILFMVANWFPFMALETAGFGNQTNLTSCVVALYQDGRFWLSAIVFVVTILSPMIVICGMLHLSIWFRMGQRPPFGAAIGRMLHYVKPWGMMEIFLVGILVSLTKVTGIATINLGISFWAFVALIVIFIAVGTRFDRHQFWEILDSLEEGDRA